MGEGTRRPDTPSLAPPDLPAPTGEKDVEAHLRAAPAPWNRVGRETDDTAMENAANNGLRSILLGVFGANSRAIAFYARQGYVEAGVRKFRVGANEYDDLVLARSL